MARFEEALQAIRAGKATYRSERGDAPKKIYQLRVKPTGKAADPVSFVLSCTMTEAAQQGHLFCLEDVFAEDWEIIDVAQPDKI